MKENRKTIFLLITHILLFLLAAAFVGSWHLSNGSKLASALAIGNAAFLLFNIPFSVFSLIATRKKRLSGASRPFVAVLSVLNLLVGIGAWTLLVTLILKP